MVMRYAQGSASLAATLHDCVVVDETDTCTTIIILRDSYDGWLIRPSSMERTNAVLCVTAIGETEAVDEDASIA